MAVFRADFLQALFEKQKNKRRHADKTENPGFRQNLQVIVMRLFDAKTSVPCVVERKSCPERIEPRAQNRMRHKNLQADRPEMKPAAADVRLRRKTDAARERRVAAEQQNRAE